MFFKCWFVLFWVVAVPLQAGEPGIDPLLAKTYRQTVDLKQWWVSEKLDGVRAIWDGKRLFFRSGRSIQAPEWFTEHFPAQPMDGELWMGRGTFEETSAAVRRKHPLEQEWRAIRYRLFELPDAEGDFSERIRQMERLTKVANVPWLQPIPQREVESEEALMNWLDRVVAAGGEGLMLHRAAAHYHGGRSGDLLKLKSWQDAEATVIEWIAGKGKYTGMMGSLLVEDRQGRRFRIGTGFSDLQRREPPPVGSQLTYKYSGTTSNGLPRFASFLRLRPDDNK